VDYFVAAGDQATRGWAKGEAVSLYKEALALLPEGDGERRRKIRLKWAIADQMLYHLPDAELLGRAQPDAPGDV
jgi:hypothetical protein